MSSRPNSLTRFWQELKRRRVVHVITVYASASFVLIELVNNLTEPLNLPPSLATIVIIILAVGFPLVVAFSWLYDLTSKGIEKTKPLDDTQKLSRTAVPNAWRIATMVSFVVILGLVTLNIVGGRGLRFGDIQSMAILPFDNFTGDDQLNWVADAMHATLLGDIGKKMSNLRLLGQTTSKAYKDSKMTATQIADRDHVGVLVEPSLTCYGDMVCIQFKAYSTYPVEKQIFVEEYTIDKSQILNLNNQIVKDFANKLKIHLSQRDETFLAESKPIDPRAYDAYLGGRYLIDQFNPQAFHAAIDSFQKAIELEPEWADAYAGIATACADMRQIGIASESDLIMMYSNMDKALELDPGSAEVHAIKAGIAAWIEFDWKTAEEEYLLAIELNPSHAQSHVMYAHMLSVLRRTDEALYQGKLAMELDPENHMTLGLYVVVLLKAEKCQEAQYYTEKALSIAPGHPLASSNWWYIYECSGDYDKLFERWKHLNIGLWEKFGVTETFEKVFREQGWIAVQKEAIRVNEEVWAKLGLLDPFSQAERYVTVGEYERAMDYFEEIFENTRNPNLPYLSCKPVFYKMKGNSRYLKLLEKMNLPVE